MSFEKYKIAFGAIELLEKNLITPNYPQEKLNVFNYSFTVAITVNDYQKIAFANTEIVIINADSQDKVAFFKTLCIFEIQEFEKIFIKNSEGVFDMPEDLEILLKSIGISTTRGIIYSEVRGTFLHGAIMPLVDIPAIVMAQRNNK